VTVACLAILLAAFVGEGVIDRLKLRSGFWRSVVDNDGVRSIEILMEENVQTLRLRIGAWRCAAHSLQAFQRDGHEWWRRRLRLSTSPTAGQRSRLPKSDECEND
jgi:hypothetical protein